MGQLDILIKLSEKFKSVPSSEEDIIFILSRIRKVLEIKDHPSKYDILNFYCNLALHAKIDKIIPKNLADELIRVHTNLEYHHPFFEYPELHKQMNEFITEYNLPNFYDYPNFNGTNFTKLLNSIYSDTPVIVKIVKKYQVSVNKDGTVTGSFLE